MKKNGIKSLFLVFMMTVLIFSFGTGCTKQDAENEKGNSESEEKTNKEVNYPLDITDQFGNKVTIEKEPKRIVSLAPSHTEILFALGLGEKIAGVTDFCNYPKEALSKEKVGSYQNINLEKIISLEPDLVIQYGQGNEETNNKMREAKIALVSYEPENVSQIEDTIVDIGKITNTEEKAKEIVSSMEKRKDAVVEKVKNAKKISTFYEIWYDPLMAAGPGSFMDELINLAGGKNIAGDAAEGYPQFDLEQLVERNPDVYLVSKDSKEKTTDSIRKRPGYEDINAVKNDRIYLLDPDIVSRPGPRIIDALELIAKSIHPELFK